MRNAAPIPGVQCPGSLPAAWPAQTFAGGNWPLSVAGLTGAPGTISFFLATHHGLLAVAAVVISLYPPVTIMLARLLLGERLTAVRLAGLSLAAASVALIAAGGAG
jgi:drug/metabolite transporter (DMT)-like permease